MGRADSVRVQLARGQVLATAVGPQVPEAGQFPVPATTPPCTFTITFVNASGVVPLSQAAFTILDEQGNLRRPFVTVAGGGALPADIPSGQKVTLIVKDVLPTGAGALRWSPEDAKPMVSWDFDVGID